MTTVNDVVAIAFSRFGVTAIDVTSLTASTDLVRSVVIDALRMVGLPSVDVATLAATTTTVREAITTVLRRLNVIPIEVAPTPNEASDALDAYNNLIYSWLTVGIDITPTIKTLDDVLGIPKAFEAGVIALLAAHISEAYGAPISTQLAALAQNGWETLQAAYIGVPHALAVFNGMLASWKSEGVDVGYTSALDMTDTIPVAIDFVETTKAMLAIRLAENAGKPIPQQYAIMAKQGWQNLRIAYQLVPNGLSALQQMILGWKAEGVDTGLSISDLTGASTWPLDDELIPGVGAMLTLRLAPECGYQIDPKTIADADAGWAQICAKYIAAGDAEFDLALTSTASQRRLTY